MLEAGIGEPSQLIVDRRAAIGLHPHAGGGDLLIGGSEVTGLGSPEVVVSGLMPWGGAGNLLGVDKDATRPQPSQDPAKR